ncbi:MAG: heat-inducible transcriptional repressor HrcA [Acidobacteriota bacterium]
MLIFFVMVLNDRYKQILKMVIDDYLSSGQPVGSRTIARKLGFGLSPATIRNIMADLEDWGYLTHPYTSAGRVPTDKGLRFYVDTFLTPRFLSEEEKEKIESNISNYKGSIDSVLNTTSKVLSDLSESMGIVISPSFEKIIFKNIHFEKLSFGNILMILVTPSNVLVTRIFKEKEYLTQDVLNRLSDYLEKNFAGKNLEIAMEYLLKEIPTQELLYNKMLKKLSTFLKNNISEGKEKYEVYLEGRENLIGKPDLIDLDALKNLIRTIEEKTKFVRFLESIVDFHGVQVFFGSDVNFLSFFPFTLVVSKYELGNENFGSLGILGSRIMPYNRIIPLVDFTAKSLSSILS